MVKRKTKKALLALILMMATCIAHAETIVTVGNLEYSIAGIYASVYGVAIGSEEIIIPPSISYDGYDYKVTKIADGAFATYWDLYNGYNKQRKGGNSAVKRVVISNTVTSIGFAAFDGSNLEYIYIPEGVENIEGSAFRRTKLKSIVIPSTVNYIGTKSSTYVGANSYVSSISIFDGCDLLRNITYLGAVPPSNWTATSQTNVPSFTTYSQPSFSINSARVMEMITINETSFIFTGKAPKPTWKNNMNEYNVSFEFPTLNPEAGTYDVVIPATFTKGEESFTAYIPYHYTIVPAKLKAKVNNASRIYGETNPNFTITYSGFVNGESESVITKKPVATTTANEKSAAGTYPIIISGGETKNYTFEYEQGELTVNKSSLGIQVMDVNKVYGSNNPTFTLVYSGLKNDETIPDWTKAPEYTTTATKESGVGTYDITVTCEPKNYKIVSNTPGKLTINKAPITIKANNVTMDYCGTMPTYSYTYSGFVNNDTEDALSTKPSIATEATATSDAGSYTITPEGAQSNNYDFTYTAGTLTINQRPLIAKVNSVSRLYGDNNPDFSIDYIGFVNDETENVFDTKPTTSTTATTQSNVGGYDIRVSGGQAKNYTFNYQKGVLTIMPRPLKAYVGYYERAYGENNPTFEILYEGLVGNDSGYSLSTQPIVRTSATRTSNVGIYDIEVTGGYSPNYTLSYGSGQLTIVKAEQTFTWNQDLTNLKVGDQVELLANASSNLPISFTMDSNDYAEIYKAGSRTYMECKKAGSFHIKAVQEGNDNYYSTARINKDVTIVGEDEYKPTLFIKQADNGMVSTKVEKGSSYTFTIHTESGWKIHSVTFNDNDVTNKLDSNNSFTTPEINESSTLSVVYEQEGSSVNMPQASEVKIQVTSYGIRVTGVHMDDVINVYAIDGILLESVRAQASQVDIPLHKDKVYVVKVGTKTMKLRL